MSAPFEADKVAAMAAGGIPLAYKSGKYSQDIDEKELSYSDNDDINNAEVPIKKNDPTPSERLRNASWSSASRLSIGEGTPHAHMFSREDSVLPPTMAHADVMGVPYCTTCKSYIMKAKYKKNHTHSGYLTKKKNACSPSVYRWCILSEGHLMYYLCPEDVGMTFPNGVLHLQGTVVVDKHPNTPKFSITRGTKTIHFKAQDMNVKREWTRMIKESFKEHAVELDIENPEQAYFCKSCDGYADLDLFTLAEVDGEVEKYLQSRSKFAPTWISFAGGHLAYYSDRGDVPQYTPRHVIHVTKGSVSGTNEHGKLFEFKVTTSDRTYYFNTYTKDDYNEWMETFKAGGYWVTAE